jgi:hypothetical protein
VPFAVIKALQPSIRWSAVSLPPRRHWVRASANGEGVRASAGMAISKVTRHSVAFAAHKPVLFPLESAIIDLALAHAANLKIVCFCESRARIGSHSRRSIEPP